MKKIFFLLLIVGFTTAGYAQNEFSNKFKAIPPVDNNYTPKKSEIKNNDPAIITAPNVFKKPDPLLPAPRQYTIGAPKEMSMVKKNDFVNPGDEIVAKYNKKEDNPEATVYRKNQNLGDFKMSSLTAKVLYRDAAYVDGDQIRVYLNDKVIQYQVNLDSNFKGFEITLEKGFNKIDFEALNQGTSGPNTAEFKVYDDKGGLISASQWNLGTGFKATILLVKE